MKERDFRTSQPKAKTGYRNIGRTKKKIYKCPYCNKFESYNVEILNKHILNNPICYRRYSNSNSTKTTKSTKKDISKTDYIRMKKYKSKIALKDKQFVGHYRCNVLNKYYKLDNIFMIGSTNDQYTFGGKNACTTISIEASMHMLYNNIKLTNVLSWNDKYIDSILKDGCLQDLQRGDLSFNEVYNQIERFRKRLKVLNEYQDNTKNNSFKFAIKKMVSVAESNGINVAAIVTKQPETICVFYKHAYKRGEKNRPKFFIVFDSHPRETDFNAHGAHVIYFKSVDSLHLYLTEWMFPTVDFEKSNLDTTYNTFQFTVIGVRENTSFKELMIKDKLLDDFETPKTEIIKKNVKKETNSMESFEMKKLKNENDQLKREVEKLKKEVKEKDEVIRSKDGKLTKFEKLKSEFKLLKANVLQFEQLLNQV